MHTASKVAKEEDQLIWPTKKTLLVNMTIDLIRGSNLKDRLHTLHCTWSKPHSLSDKLTSPTIPSSTRNEKGLATSSHRCL